VPASQAGPDPRASWPEPIPAAPEPVRPTNGSRPQGAEGPPGRGRNAPPVMGPLLRPLLISRTKWWQRVRAVVVLALIAAILGGALAATLGLIVWGIATGIHHAANN
jgi:hypothetical protein